MKRQPRPAGAPRRRPAARASDPSALIYAVVRRIPRGYVATYGEIAALAGMPSGHRVAARAMRSCPETLPWQRVIGKKDARRGQISIDDPDHAALQRALLEHEGICFDAQGFVPLRRFGWLNTSVKRSSRSGTRSAASAAQAAPPKRRPRRA